VRSGPGECGPRGAEVTLDGSLAVFAAVDGVPAGAFLFEDPVRPDAPRMVRALRTAGIARVLLVTGDRPDIAETVGRIVGVDAIHAGRDPAAKLAIVRAEQAAAPTVMAGDGINDAPALAAAGVGVALAARGVTAAAEAADVVLTVDRIDALADAILIARRSGRIARRAVLVGMGLSLAAMAAAAAGALPPAAGALLQELIDVAAIAIALTALLPGRRHTVAMAPADLATARRLYAEHRAVRPVVEQIRTVADALTSTGSDLRPVRALLGRLETRLLPHERAEQAELVPSSTARSSPRSRTGAPRSRGPPERSSTPGWRAASRGSSGTAPARRRTPGRSPTRTACAGSTGHCPARAGRPPTPP
jgi:soluble P-type ATPase